MKQKQHRIYLFITILIFIFCTCFVVFLETHTFYDGLPDTTDIHFERSEVYLLDTSKSNPLITESSAFTMTSDLEYMIKTAAGTFDYDSILLTEVIPSYLENSDSLHFYTCNYIKDRGSDGVDCNQALFLEYKGHLLNPGYPNRTNFNPDYHTVDFQSAAILSLDNTTRPEIFFTCAYDGFLYLCIVDTGTFQIQWIDCEYYFYERSEQEDWLITIHDSGIRQKKSITLRLCAEDADSEPLSYYPSESVGTLQYTNNGYILQKKTAYIYQPDDDTKQFINYMLENDFIEKDSKEYFAYRQLLTNMKRFRPDVSAKDLFFVYILDCWEQDSDTYDMHIYYRSPDDEDEETLEKDIAFIDDALSFLSDEHYKDTVDNLILNHK